MTLSTERLESAVPPPVRDLCRRLREAGHRSWLVGGCIRDELSSEIRGAPSDPGSAHRKDWDVATSARPEEVMRLFHRVVPTGIQHGTVTVLLSGEQYEVTTLRGESTYSDGRRPDSVHFVDDIQDDLARRDFTINAMAYDLSEERLIDPFGGVEDLKQRVLRAVGTASERFAEDGLRVLRAARFVATLEVDLAPETEQAIEPSLFSYKKVSPERVRDEWLKTMHAREPSRAFEVMRRHGLLAVSAPELLESVGCAQNRYHRYDVWEHGMRCLDHCPPDPILRTAGLLHDVGKPRTRALNDKTGDYTFYEHERVGAELAEPLLERLRFSNDERAKVVALVRHHLVCYDESWSDAAVRRWLRRVTPALAPDLYLLVEADVRAKGFDPAEELARVETLKGHVARVLEAGAALSVKDLQIDGHDLMRALGLSPGPVLGEILRTLLDAVVEDPSRNTPEALLARARTLLSPEP